METIADVELNQNYQVYMHILDNILNYTETLSFLTDFNHEHAKHVKNLLDQLEFVSGKPVLNDGKDAAIWAFIKQIMIDLCRCACDDLKIVWEGWIEDSFEQFLDDLIL